MPMSGRKSGSVATLPTTARFSSVCDATCPTTSPVTSACARALLRDPLGDAQHQPAVDHDAHRRRHRQQHLLLDFAERHQIETRPVLPARQQRHQLARLLAATRATGSGSCGSARTSTVQPRFIIRHAATGESMPPESRHTTRPAVPVGSPPGPRSLLEEVERLVGQQLERGCRAPAARDRRASPCAALMRPPTSRSICGDVSGKRLSARRADTRKLRHAAIAEVAQHRGGDAVEVDRHAAREREVGDAERVADALGHLVGRARPGRARPRCVPSARAPSCPGRSDTARRRLRTSRARNQGRFFPLSAISW